MQNRSSTPGHLFPHEPLDQHQHFIFVITNCNALLTNSQAYQQIAILNDPTLTVTEQSLYVDLYMQIRQAVRHYLQQTTRMTPIHFVFDLSDE